MENYKQVLEDLCQYSTQYGYIDFYVSCKYCKQSYSGFDAGPKRIHHLTWCPVNEAEQEAKKIKEYGELGGNSDD